MDNDRPRLGGMLRLARAVWLVAMIAAFAVVLFGVDGLFDRMK
jgi:hypothetical protein